MSEISLRHTEFLSYSRPLARLGATLALWRQRARGRSELARLSVRDLRDIGLSTSEARHEAAKPFWRP
ncbi:MAG TPA: DUF1127 domain-containing protein [Alphaproteobacteria bacterium]|nr:DUF1127 domain-containing protein [Alphaproteobacteria bacterium]